MQAALVENRLALPDEVSSFTCLAIAANNKLN